MWIGLNDRGSFGKFHWMDESPLDYTNWAAGQPDGIVTRPVSIGGQNWCEGVERGGGSSKGGREARNCKQLISTWGAI